MHALRFLAAVVPMVPAALLLPSADPASLTEVTRFLFFSLGGFLLTWLMVPSVAEMTVARGLGGVDLNKIAPGADRSKEKKVPEGLGLVVGISYLVVVILYQVFAKHSVHNGIDPKLSDYNAALHSVCFIILLGFADDVLDLRWRYKLVLPLVATLPLLMSYTGTTAVVVPTPLRAYIGSDMVELSYLYLLYMLLLAIFCTNAINIYAGINGLEAGQSLVVGCAVVTHNIIELGGAERDYHLFSLSLMLPFVAVTYGLLYYNWFPSRVFVGDTFTYFAGMALAVVAILGHFSKTLMLFFMPQILNFLLSLYQILIGPLFGVKCPRHRLPRFDPKSGKLYGISGHHNLVNFTLLVTGPLHEETLCWVLMVLQVATCGLGFWIRYSLSSYVYQ